MLAGKGSDLGSLAVDHIRRLIEMLVDDFFVLNVHERSQVSHNG